VKIKTIYIGSGYSTAKLDGHIKFEIKGIEFKFDLSPAMVAEIAELAKNDVHPKLEAAIADMQAELGKAVSNA
jgi:hypothetical protein